MLTCINARSKDKQLNDDSVDQTEQKTNKIQLTKQNSVKSITSQFKDIAVKASGAYRHCNPCTGTTTTTTAHQQQVKNNTIESESSVSAAVSERFRWSFRRTGSVNSTTTATATALKPWGKEMEARLKGISSGEGTPRSVSLRRVDPVVFVEEVEPKEWVAQVEPGVMITFVSLPRGGNDLKRIRFSQEMFNKWQAQKWWTENYDRVMELYNVQRLDRHVFPLPRSEDEVSSQSSKLESADDTPITPPLTQERLPRNLNRPTGLGKGYSSSDSMEQQSMQSLHHRDSGFTSTPKLSSISGAKTETSTMDASIRTSSSRDVDRSGELSTSNASEMEAEWVEEDEPGVYITIRAMPNGPRELRRVRFSREKFGEVHARLWWEENRKRIREQYLC